MHVKTATARLNRRANLRNFKIPTVICSFHKKCIDFASRLLRPTYRNQRGKRLPAFVALLLLASPFALTFATFVVLFVSVEDNHHVERPHIQQITFYKNLILTFPFSRLCPISSTFLLILLHYSIIQ